MDHNRRHQKMHQKFQQSGESGPPPSSIKVYKVPSVKRQLVEGGRTDGNFLHKVRTPTGTYDLVGLGSDTGLITYYHNPLNPNILGPWKKTQIAKVESPVGMNAAPLRKVNPPLEDIFVTTHFGQQGSNFSALNPVGGHIIWLENPGTEKYQGANAPKKLTLLFINETSDVAFITSNTSAPITVTIQPGKTVTVQQTEGTSFTAMNSQKQAIFPNKFTVVKHETIIFRETAQPDEIPSGTDADHWKPHYVGRSTTAHRIPVGHFSTTNKWQVLGLPLVAHPNDTSSPVSIVLFSEPDDLMNAENWDRVVIDDKNFHLVQDGTVIPKMNPFGASNLDSAIIASQEGLHWLYFDEAEKKFKFLLIGTGAPQSNIKYKGSGIGVAGIDKTKKINYIAGLEPFHGNYLAVYKPKEGADNQPVFDRIITDKYGNPDSNDEGPAQHIEFLDFDGDGANEFLVALRGPDPNEGVVLYKPIDLASSKFEKIPLTQESAARIAVADFDNDGALDFATIAYSVEGGFKAPSPSVYVYYNRPKVVVDIPRNFATAGPQQKILSIAGVDVIIDVIPAGVSRDAPVSGQFGVKVLLGSIEWKEHSKQYSRESLITPRTASQLAAPARYQAGPKGAVVVTLHANPTYKPKPQGIEDIPIDFPLLGPGNAIWHKVEDLEWGGNFKGLEFWNADGFKVQFEDSQHIAYIQFWVAGTGVDAGLHNHSDNTFGEVHATLVNGTEGGRMDYAPNLDYYISPEAEKQLVALPVPAFHEHGPLWEIADGKPIMNPNGNILYPTHRWHSGTVKGYDVWAAFEFNPLFINTN